MCKQAIFVGIILALFHMPHRVNAQDYSAVLEVISKFEKDINSLIASERKQRSAEIASLRKEIRRLRGQKTGGEQSVTSHQYSELNQRITAMYTVLENTKRELMLEIAMLEEKNYASPALASVSNEDLVQYSELTENLEMLLAQMKNATATNAPAHQREVGAQNIAPVVKTMLPRGLTVGGSLRLRNEMKSDFNFDNSNQDFFLTQLRLSLKWQLAPWITLFLQGQDARVFGEEATAAPGINENKTPNIYADDFDLHQGYVDLKFSAGNTAVQARIGRQKFNMGTQRLSSSLEWVNTARVWDGLRVTVGKKKKRTLDIITSRLVPVNPNSLNDYSKTGSRYFNSYFHELYFTDWLIFPNTQFEGYWMWRNESGVGDATQTLGTRFESKYADWDFDGDFAVQFGEYGGLKHRAFMVHIGGGYTAKSLNNSNFSMAYNFGSGDDDPTDGTHKTFDNLYPLNHAFYGYMDLFSLQNIHNLEMVFKTKFSKKIVFRAALQNFWLANAANDAWYNAGVSPIRNANGQDVGSYVGSEIDFTLKYPVAKKIVLVGGYSHLFTGSYIKDTGGNTGADFLFLMTKITY